MTKSAFFCDEVMFFRRKRDSVRKNHEATSEGVNTGKVKLVVAAAAVSVGAEFEAVSSAGLTIVEAVRSSSGVTSCQVRRKDNYNAVTGFISN